MDSSGNPVRAEVFYHPARKNPNVVPPGAFGVISSDGYRTKPDGTFYLTVWPGKGVIDVRASDDRFATVDVEKTFSKLGVRSRPVGSVNALVVIDADPKKPESMHVAVKLTDGIICKGTVVGPGGKSAKGIIAAGLYDGPLAPMKSNDFTLTGLGPTSRRLLLFMDLDKKLGVIQPVSGSATESLTVKLAPLGSVAGVVRNADKQPFAKLAVTAIPLRATWTNTRICPTRC